ncbi:hypothetical protein F3Y22_tig00110210pilonHSYRG00043 [Hibiscus syriacus]|uniref:Integrase catalytic domain-containing protein n=1 Tax=Hibiscus syriacus TaxID=106335 RepID=A0A6A3BCQ9_HIBSY|nr:hypothetical protein F3Y22_tig00110210pilonHSYRG00043 [Hibiscus syriacus]
MLVFLVVCTQRSWKRPYGVGLLVAGLELDESGLISIIIARVEITLSTRLLPSDHACNLQRRTCNAGVGEPFHILDQGTVEQMIDAFEIVGEQEGSASEPDAAARQEASTEPVHDQGAAAGEVYRSEIQIVVAVAFIVIVDVTDAIAVTMGGSNWVHLQLGSGCGDGFENVLAWAGVNLKNFTHHTLWAGGGFENIRLKEHNSLIVDLPPPFPEQNAHRDLCALIEHDGIIRRTFLTFLAYCAKLMIMEASAGKTFMNKKVNIILDEANFLLLKQQILLTVHNHRLERLLIGVARPLPGTIEVENAETTTAVWSKVLQFFANRSTTTVISLYYKLQSLKKGSDNMCMYLTRIKEVCDALDSCDSAIPQTEQVPSILKGLPREYQLYIALITTMKDALSLDKIYSMLIDAETQLAGFDAQEGLLFDQSFTGQSAEQAPQSHIASSTRDHWVLDSGATHHVTADSTKVFSSKEFSGPGKLLVGNGSLLPIQATANKVDSSNHLYDLWHRRLGHPAHATLEQICKLIDVNFEQKVNENCSACHMGKSHKLPFTDSITKYDFPFQLVFSDLWGPSPVISNGFRYYVSFVDASTRHTWLYLLKDKSQATQVFLLFQQLVATQFRLKVLAMQIDWGGEYRPLSRVLAEAGVSHRVTCPHTSKQNGVVERKYHHMVELALVLLAQASIPISYWSYAMVTTVHLINRLPTRVLVGKSPFECMFNKKPDYGSLKVFGCQCFPHLRSFNSHKLDFWSQPCTFLGPSPQYRGYVCLTPDKRVVVSRHVKLDEWCSPFAQENASGHGFAQSSDAHESAVASDELGSVKSKCGVFQPKIYTTFFDDIVPATVEEAFQSGPWSEAVNVEYSALIKNGTWSLIHLPANRSVEGCKWLFKIKRNPDGSVYRYKARLVAKGFTQVPGFDFTNTFNLVVKFSIVYFLLALAIARGWALRQVDVNNAFFNGDLSEVVYMHQPPRFEKCAENETPLDDCSTYTLVYVDDIIITGTSVSAVDQVVRLLSLRLSLKDIDELSYFLGIEVKKVGVGLLLSQRAYICELLKKTNMSQAISVCTPMVAMKVDDQASDLLPNAREYKSIVGALLYVCHTSPDIAFVVNKAAQFMQSLRTSHFAEVKRILRYLAGSLDHGLVFSKGDARLCVKAFSDADWAGDASDRRSMS